MEHLCVGIESHLGSEREERAVVCCVCDVVLEMMGIELEEMRGSWMIMRL